MGEIMCVGVSHFPGFAYPDDHMADILRRHLLSPKVPAERKEPSSWPEQMVKEFGLEGENATDSAAIHRERVMSGYRKVREEIDAFKPDFILIWGDDQYENFHEDLVPPFAVYVSDDFETRPFKRGAGWAMDNPKNYWNEPDDKAFPVKGHSQAARFLTRRLLEEGYAIPYAYKMHHFEGLGHAFMNTIMYLDYDRVGFDYPVVPFHVNAYGSSLVRNRGGDSLKNAAGAEADPPAPSAKLCYELGKATARILRESPWRCVLIGSSSWSHAFLTEKNAFLYPDIEADRLRHEQLRDHQQTAWRGLSNDEIEDAGQHELRNWIPMAGAVEELELSPEIIDFTESYIFNSSKCTMVAKSR